MLATRRGFGRLILSTSFAAALGPGVSAFGRSDADGPANVFFSPHGRPYRAPSGAPYPVVDWFKDADRNSDGKLDRDEFVADAAAFFDVLDVNGDGVLGQDEVALYEHNIAPEVLGMRVTVYADGQWRVQPDKGHLWLAQYDPMEGPISGSNPSGSSLPGQPGRGRLGDPSEEGGVLPPGAEPNAPDRAAPGPETQGAAPYGLIAEPEPVTAADPDFLFRGVVRRSRFLAHAQSNFDLLDRRRSGFLTLAGLPMSQVQTQLGRGGRRR